MNISNIVFLLLIQFLITSCSLNVVEHGYSFADVDINQNNYQKKLPRKMEEREVLEFLGSPTIIDDLGSCRSFYYVEGTFQNRILMKNRLLKNQILTINFDHSHLINSVDFQQIIYDKDIAICSDTTEVKGNKMKIIQQFVRNIGRFNATPGNQAR